MSFLAQLGYLHGLALRLPTRPPACYGRYPARRAIPYAKVCGWHLRPGAALAGPPWRQPEPEVPVTPEDMIAWRARHPEAICNNRIAWRLCALERDFAPRPT